MKVEQLEVKFRPVVITLETYEDLCALRAALYTSDPKIPSHRETASKLLEELNAE